jgi:hypothetical protein
MEERGDGGGVGGDTRHVRSRRERADLQGPTGETEQGCLQLVEVDVTVGILGNDDDICNRLPPRQFIAVVFERPDEHNGFLLRRDLIGKSVAVIEAFGDADAENPDHEVDGTGRSTAAEDDRVLVGGADAAANDAAGVLPETSRLQTCTRGLGVGVGVQRKDLVADVVLDKRQRPPRRGVIRIGDPARSERSVDDVVAPDDGLADVLEEVFHAGRRLVVDQADHWPVGG